MRFLIFTLAISFAFSSKADSQTRNNNKYFIQLNEKIDSLVVAQNVKALDTLYAGDFVFSHGTGLIEHKTDWLNTVAKTKYPERKHDSVTVEIHSDVTILRGKLHIRRIDKVRTTGYTLKYVRVYAVRKNRWQLISHITTEERDEI